MALEGLLPVASVADFYDGQEVLVTGGTGFLGKTILEKLLFSCPKVKKIYLLLREKRGSPVVERLETLKKDAAFSRVKEHDAALLDKLVPIAGDVRELGLQMSAESVQLIQSVSIIIHGAATVRFDEPLKESIIMNTRGTREVLNLAKGLKGLKLFAHISTAYCNPHLELCEEKLYPIDSDWRATIKMAETLDLETLEVFAKKVIDYHPNSYTFSKQLSEHMVNDHRHELPIIIHRPSIVSPSIKEPIVGWVDNFNGPVGIMLPISFGISRVLLGSADCRLNFVPVDYVTNSLISAIAQAAPHLERNKQLGKVQPEVPIYNYGVAKAKGIPISEIIQTGIGYNAIYPVENMMWYPSTFITSSILLYKLFFYFAQLLPALIIDLILRLVGRKISLVRIQRKIYYVQVSLLFFMSHQFDFGNQNTMHSLKLLSPADQQFKFSSELYFYPYLGKALLGARKYLLNQDPKTIPRSKIWYRILQVIYYFFMSALAYFVIKRYLLSV